MKTIKARLLVLITIAAAAAPLNAQSPAAGKPGPKATATALPAGASPQPGDPFIKKQVTGNPGGDAAVKKSTPAYNIYFTVETYAMAQADAAQLIAENASGKIRHERVLELARQGKARFETLLSSVTKNGQRASVQPIDEIRYPVEFYPPSVAGEPAIPTGYETRDVGDYLEYEPVLSPDLERCDINMALSSVRWRGFRDFGVQDGGPLTQPMFNTRKITSSMRLSIGGAEFLGTLSNPPQFDTDKDEVRLVFGRVDLMEATPEEPAKQVDKDATLEHQLSFYSLSREAGRELLAHAKKSGDCYAAVQALAGRKEARLERLAILNTKSGQRAVVEEIEETRYAKGYMEGSKETNDTGKNPEEAAPTIPPYKSARVAAASFETRNVGLVLEIESVFDRNSTIDINLVPSLVRLVGNPQPTGISAKYPPQPLFETRKIATSFSAVPGEQMLIGTFNPPGDTGVNGQKDTGRIWLGFLRTAVAKP